MAYKIIFKRNAIKDLDGIDNKTRERIIKKLEWLIKQNDPLAFAVRLTDPIIGQFRFRIGSYRVIFDHCEGTITILKIGHRSSIYK